MKKKSRLSSRKRIRPSYQCLEPRNLLAAMPIVTEFVASNSDSLNDDNGNSSDWIEIYNAGDSIATLTGFTLTDDPGEIDKWTFPATTLAAGEYLVLFAGTDADPSSGTDLYTGFGLSAGGEYLGFYDENGVAISEFQPGGGEYPGQFTDVSYGVLFDGNFDSVSYFGTPTPGAANTNAVDGVTSRVISDIEPGFFDSNISVSLSTATAGASIYFTTDGSTPSISNGTLYTGPITISSTTNLRAVSTKANYLSNFDRTWSYFFLDDVLDQSNDGSAPPNWPTSWGGNVVDYGIDPQVINIEGEQAVRDALLAIPTWSVTTDLDNLFDTSTGIYSNADEDGRDWERAASLEQLNTDGTLGFQANAGIRIRGGFSRSDNNPKHAFKFFFRGEYGDSSLEYDLFGDDVSSTTSFEKIDLRTAQNYSWSFYGDTSNTFVTDVLARENQAALGQQSTRSHWVHLYLNGQYWGLYQTQERADANFGASYFGGDADDYDVLKPERGPYANIATDGNFDAYDDLFQQALARAADGVTPAFVDDAAYMKAQGLNPDGSENPAFETLLDVENLTAYMIVILHGGNFDAPISNFLGNNRINNYFAIRDRTGNEGFRFFVHDSEHTHRDVNLDRNGPWNHANFESDVEYFNPQWLHQQLMANENYRTQFADKIQEAFFNDGPLSADAQIARLDAHVVALDQAIIAESARWGDAKNNNPRLRSNWINATDSLRTLLANREDIFVEQLRNTTMVLKDGNGNYNVTVDAPLFPQVDAPTYLIDGAIQSGGTIDAGDLLTLSADDIVYYTTDGSDPRLPDGSINPDAIAYDPSTVSTTIFTTGSQWKYLDDGSNQGTAWQSPTFNDSSWASGSSELGYGDGDEATVVGFGPDASDKYVTTYFRKAFNLDAGNYSAARVEIKRDDGAVIYFNGVEIGRSNMGSGTIEFDDFAASVTGGASESQWFSFDINPSLLQEGSNTLAVEIHQANAGSSDITFDARFIVTTSDADGIPLDVSTNVKARTLANGEWSALHDATFVIPGEQSDLRISEINYNPADPTAAEIAAGFDDNDDFEFIEIYNPHTVTSVNLNGVQLSSGVSFSFGDYELLPGERVVVVEDVDAFVQRYGNDTAVVLGQWSGGLSNGGEVLTLVDSDLDEVMSVDYGDGSDDPWYIPTDGNGYTLVLNDPENTPVADLGEYFSWRPSAEIGGTPGGVSGPQMGTAPTVSLALVNEGANQRSAVNRLTITLDGDVEVDANAITLIQRSNADGVTGTVVETNQTCSLDGDGNTVLVITFTSLTRNGVGDLEDGNYQLTIDHTKVRRAGTSITMEQDFVIGDTAADNFFAYYGDNNGDRTVNVFDLLAFRQTYRLSTGDTGFNAAMDLEGNGTVNVFDLLGFRQRYRESLPFA
jgi:hypothetical protein